ncbi:hypothetical protein OG345_24350 [Streptomyces sp. NBC_01220]|uniref:hypothetical protein n=1 Tax=unclassified Streptomyces TaxID=2593676 RepID=UPI002E30B801|nr:hypothetical protein [Streptomyces sp. NBC_01358]WSQ45893.1 hypothetical protein OG345_24350 [Streptomyces sp. NBC_01220]
MTVIDESLARILEERGLFLSLERTETVEVGYLCVDDGIPGGFPIGYVMSSGAGTWSAYARVRPGRVFVNDRVSTGLPDIGEAVRSVLTRARFEDVMSVPDD